jgi:Uma2 family endonuclease
MGLPKRQPYVTSEEFWEIQRTSEVPLEYMNGEVVAMAGGSKAHGQIVQAVSMLAGVALRNKPCEASSTISVKAPVSFLIPDVVVYCNGGEFTNEDELLLNPVVIFEVLSNSTEGYDHGPKWIKYQHIESLQHYAMISQDEPAVEVYTRDSEGDWRYKLVSGLDGSVRLSHLDLTLTLADIYERVEFVVPQPPS